MQSRTLRISLDKEHKAASCEVNQTYPMNTDEGLQEDPVLKTFDEWLDPMLQSKCVGRTRGVPGWVSGLLKANTRANMMGAE